MVSLFVSRSSQYAGTPSSNFQFSLDTEMDYMIGSCDDIVERQDEAGGVGIDTNSQDLTGEKVAQAENPNVGNAEQPLPELRMDLTDDLLYLVCPALKFCL